MKLENILPEVYYKESRDFSYIARLIEILTNYMKTAADNVNRKTSNKNIDNYLLQLLANTLGFKLKHNYNTKDLLYICTSLVELYRKKGSISAITDAIQLLINSQGIDQKIVWKENLKLENGNLTLSIPSALTDTVLIEDLFDYILPAGITYSFIRVNNVTYDKETNFVVVKHLDNDSGFNKLSIEESSSLLEAQNTVDIDGEQGKYLGNIGSTIVVNIENKAKNTEGGN